MKIKSVLVIEVEAEDFVAAGKHQAAIEKLVAPVVAVYPQAEISFNQIKRRAIANQQTPSLRVASSTGNMNRYDG